MGRRGFRWTRETYKRASSLCRFMNRNIYYLPPDPPRLVKRFFDLWEKHPQSDDPLERPMLSREHYSGLDSSIPF